MRPTQQRHPRSKQTSPGSLKPGLAGTAHATMHRRARALSLAVATSVLLTGCGPLRPGVATAMAAAPPSVDPSTSGFTCPGLTDTSVKAVFSSISLHPPSFVRPTARSGTWSARATPEKAKENQRSVLSSLGTNRSWIIAAVIEVQVRSVSRCLASRTPRATSAQHREAREPTASSPVERPSSWYASPPTPPSMRGDPKENVRNLIRSMTSWACDGETIPGRRVPLSPTVPINQTPTHHQ